jgi:hypothetical protein
MNDQKTKIKESLQEHITVLKERNERITQLETLVKQQALEADLHNRNARSPSMIARNLAKSLILGADNTLKVIDENGFVRRNFRTTITEAGDARFESYEMTIPELVAEFLNKPEHTHFHGDYQAETEKKSRSVSEEEYQRLLVEAQKAGRVTEEFLRAYTQKYSQKRS